MSIHDKIRACNGVTKFLNKFNTGKPRNNSFRAIDEHLNGVLIQYLKERGEKYQRNNSPNYKGNNQPILENAYRLQSDFPAFREWVMKNFEQ